jgi:nicotinamide-nucleotide amidase
MQDLISEIAEQLLAKHQFLAVAESCTGGWLSKVCTDLPGSSKWFERGYITYSNRAKVQMLGVNENTLDIYGAVSEQTVHEMVVGALSNNSAHWGIAISGVAGPDGGSKVNPVGTVWFAWLESGRTPVSIKKRFSGGREKIRQRSVEFALEELLKLLK